MKRGSGEQSQSMRQWQRSKEGISKNCCGLRIRSLLMFFGRYLQRLWLHFFYYVCLLDCVSLNMTKYWDWSIEGPGSSMGYIIKKNYPHVVMYTMTLSLHICVHVSMCMCNWYMCKGVCMHWALGTPYYPSVLLVGSVEEWHEGRIISSASGPRVVHC